MQIQIVNFQLKGISEEDYRKMCDQLAPAFAAVDGLTEKVWLADSATGTFGGVYTWRDREAMENYLKSDLCQAVLNHPNLSGITSRDFAVLEGPSRTTRGFVEPAA